MVAVVVYVVLWHVNTTNAHVSYGVCYAVLHRFAYKPVYHWYDGYTYHANYIGCHAYGQLRMMGKCTDITGHMMKTWTDVGR